MKQDLDRRSFLTGMFTVGAIAAGGTLVGCSITSGKEQDGKTYEWQKEADVVIVGTGFAGLSAAIEAADAGSSVIVIEKAPEREAGGNSRVCAQAVWTPSDVPASIRYFKEITTAYHLQDIPDDIIEAYISEGSKNAEWLDHTVGIEMLLADSIEYPHAPSAADARKKCMAISSKGLGFSRVWDATKAAVDERPVEIFYETTWTDLIFNDDGDVIGIEVEKDGSKINIAAYKGVILCCGGHEYDQVMNSNYLRFPALAWGTPYNTGDGHKICMAYDIDFWHMNSATPATRIGLKMPLGDKYSNSSLDIELTRATPTYIWVDKYGKRFMNESSDYQHGYGRNAIFFNDGERMEWPRLPFWQIFDESVATYLTTRPALSSGWLEVIEGMTLSAGFEKEMAAGVIFKANTAEELAGKIGMDPSVLASTLSTYNDFAEAGEDEEFERPDNTMKPLSGTLYAAQVYPVMVNTNGGPRRNAKAQILRTDGSTIPRLYSAGEFGSIWAWYYQGAGNMSECTAFGRIAGRNAAALESWNQED